MPAADLVRRPATRARLAVLAVVGWFAPVAWAQPVIHVFYSPTCQECHEIQAHMDAVLKRHPGFVVKRYNINDPKNVELMVDMQIAYQVPEEAWGTTTAIFLGRHWWTDADKFKAQFESALANPGTPPRGAAAQPQQAQSWLVHTFERFGVAAVALAGLADSINPCALAALIFLISYLSFARRSPGEILATGLLFAAGVFVAYLGVGLGLFRGLQMLSGFELASKLLYPAVALGTLLLTVLSVRDWWRARLGRVAEMTLTLPTSIKRLSHGVVRRWVGGPAFLALAFACGLVISLLELLCTGQIYLPTLLYIASTESLRARALGLLLIYVALFTLPIVVLALAVYFGVSSQRLVQWGQKHTATGKLALALVFLGLTVYLVAFSLHIWAGV